VLKHINGHLMNNLKEQRINEIITYAREWIGTPYIHQGRQLGVGCDCAGFLIKLAEKFGYQPEDMKGYAPIPDMKEMMGLIDSQMVRIPDKTKCQWADIALMSFKKNGCPHHIGMITPRGILHCNENLGKVVEHGINACWAKKIKFIYRLPDIAIMTELEENINKAFDNMTGEK